MSRANPFLSRPPGQILVIISKGNSGNPAILAKNGVTINIQLVTDGVLL